MAILVKPEELRNKSLQFNANMENQRDVIKNSRNLLEELISDGFSGATANAFITKWDDLEPSLINACDLLGEVGDALNKAADNFETLDSEMASLLK